MGENVTLKCETDSGNPVTWTFYPFNGPQPSIIHTGLKHLLVRYKITIGGGKSSLTIIDVQDGDIGRYKCGEYLGSANSYVNFQLNIASKFVTSWE